MKSLLPHICDWFLQKEEYLVAFAEADSRIEGWFKAEMIVLLNRLAQQGRIDEFQREWNIPTPYASKRWYQIDFRIVVKGTGQLCELKALCISQAATPRDLEFYFRDNHLGLVKDLRKLDTLSSNEQKWVLGFVYPAPVPAAWRKVTDSLVADLKHWKCLTKPQDFPPFMFISLWKQGK